LQHRIGGAAGVLLVPRVRPWLAGGAVLVLLAVLAGTGWRDDDGLGRLFAEDGPVELVQVVVLLAASALFAMSFVRGLFAVGQASLVLSVAGLIAAMRETPRCDSLFYEGGICIQGDLKNGVYVAMALLVVVGLILKPSIRPRLLTLRQNLIVARHLLWTWPAVLAAVAIASTEILEASGFYRTEEAMELAGYVYFAAFATWLLRNVGTLSAQLVGALETEGGFER
jgi:hypothetical protein